MHRVRSTLVLRIVNVRFVLAVVGFVHLENSMTSFARPAPRLLRRTNTGWTAAAQCGHTSRGGKIFCRHSGHSSPTSR